MTSYRHRQAHYMARKRYQEKNKRIKLATDIKQKISNSICSDWSSEQVAHRLEKDGVIKLQHETYLSIYKDR